VKKGEIFGLLGPNGAGKSTTFNLITLKDCRSQGEIIMLGSNLNDSAIKYKFTEMGICPQNNMLFDSLSVQEHFYFYSCIKGMSYEHYDEQTNYIIRNLAIEEYRHIRAMNLSGGNKRKLMCGLCILSCPILSFLDEPTTGVDPVARLKLRATIKAFSKIKDSSYVFTTHWMEEAEQMCDRVCILINGRAVVIGSPEDLRRK